MGRVAYVSTSDGVRIAYSVHGRGLPLIYMPPLPFRHVELEWESPGDRRVLEWLAARYELIQYDPRGLGLSDRSPVDYSPEALLGDLDAVIGATVGDGAVLFAAVNAAPLALAFAAERPERVSHLILWCASPRVAEGLGAHLGAILGLMERDWDLAIQTLSHLLRGWSAGESAEKMAAVLRGCARPEAVRELWAKCGQVDVTPVLERIAVPTLVLHRRGVTWVPLDRATELASRIPGARLVLLQGDSMAPWAGDVKAWQKEIAEFLGSTRCDETVAPALDTFRREGEYWTLSFRGEVCRLRDAKGLHHIAYLLCRPGELIAAAELLVDLEPPPPGAPPAGSRGDVGPLLDGEARRAYSQRIEALRDELAEAERFNDPARRQAARAEIEAIEDQVAAAVGLGGRNRSAASNAERARVTVTKRIRDSLARIGKSHPALAAHLERSVRTGSMCVYRPSENVSWSL